MNRPYIFLSGEFRITMPLVFQHDKWQHTMTASFFTLNDNNSFRRKNKTEELLGCIYYATVSSEEIRRQNYHFLIDNNIPCYPDPNILLRIDNRHECMRMCLDAGLVKHQVIQGEYGINIPFSTPYVIKTGNDHQGQGKHLITSETDIPEWEGIATIEPFFNGTSCRVLWVGDQCFSLKFDNEFSWVKNSSGAELSLFPNMPIDVIDHSLKVKELFSLDVCGIDYIVNEKTGEWWFLEYNCFPGLDISDASIPIIHAFFKSKMKEVENVKR